MEETQIQVQETLQKISPKLNLRISSQGDISLSGKIKTDELQMILDDSLVKSRNYLEYQKYIDSEMNKSSIIIGLIFSSLIGLIVFCLFNQSKSIPSNQSLGVIYVDFK